MNRCLSEGRRAFFDRVAGIEAGAECERLAPLLSALADGEAGADDLVVLRPHLRSCLACRAQLREYRAAPSRVAALVPPALVAAGGTGDGPGALRSLVESIVGATHDKAAAFGERAHAAAELATGQKLAAVAASAAALAGGGAGVERLASQFGENGPQQGAVHAKPINEQTGPAGPAAPAEPPATERAPNPDPAAPSAPSPEPPPPDPANEFAPAPVRAPPPQAPPAASLGPAGSAAATGGGGTSEFGP